MRVNSPTSLQIKYPHAKPHDFHHAADLVAAGHLSPGFAMTPVYSPRKSTRKSRSKSRSKSRKSRSKSKPKHRAVPRSRAAVCSAFRARPRVSPITGRKIKASGPAHKKLVAMCRA